MWGMIGAGLLGAALGSKASSKPKSPEKMSYEEAMEQAEGNLRRPYEENREQVLDDINRNMISKGFYGQAPGDHLTQDAMTDMANDYQTQKSRYATNLRNTDYAEAWQKYQHDLQQSEKGFADMTTGAALGYQIGGGWGAGLGALAGAFF